MMKLFTNPISEELYPIASHCVLCGVEQWDGEQTVSGPLHEAIVRTPSVTTWGEQLYLEQIILTHVECPGDGIET